MSDANKWPIKDKEVVVAVVTAGNDNNMLNNDGNDGGDIEETNTTTAPPPPPLVVVVVDNGEEVAKAEEETEAEKKKKKEEEEKEERKQKDAGHKENDNIPNDHNNDNNCGSARDSLSLGATLQLRRSPELRQTVKSDTDGTGASGTGNEVEGAFLAATRTPPFPMPSPSAKPRTPGILRLDTSGKKSRRSSGISSTVEFRNDPEMLGESTPTSSNPISPQLSVTWAFQRDSRSYSGAGGDHHANHPAGDENPPLPARQSSVDEEQKQAKSLLKIREVFGRKIRNKLKRDDTRCASQKIQRKLPDPLLFMDTSKYNSLDAAGPGDSEDEDYSQSVSAIMQRRASTHRGRSRRSKSPRRSSSPLVASAVPNHNAHYSNPHATMNNTAAIGGGGGAAGAGGAGAGGGGGGADIGGDRRRSSVYTTSSGDTAISFEDDGNNQGSSKEQIVENIRLHKEVLQSVKYQTWSMRRKLRLVRQAKSYVARHEGALQERYAQSRNTGALWARFKLLFAAKMQHIRRELTNFSTQLIPWESRIKEIESHFGSVVASYFTFLRWLLWVNIVIAFAFALFVVVPEVVASANPTLGPGYKRLLKGEVDSASYLSTTVAFEGYLKYSALFYGYYSNVAAETLGGYKLPLAYFLTGLAIYIYSFIATLRKMAKNSRMSKLSSKDDECIFSWKLFTGWDFLIGHAETAHNRIASVVLSFKEALLEEAEKKKNKGWKIICIRIFVNIIVLALLCASAYAVIMVVERSSHHQPLRTWFGENEITICITFISHVFPIMFDILGCFENYHPRKQLRLQLARIMFLNLLTLYALIFAQFMKINQMNKQSAMYKELIGRAEIVNGSITLEQYMYTTPVPYENFSQMFLSSFSDDYVYPVTADSVVKTVVKNAPLALKKSPMEQIVKATTKVFENVPVTGSSVGAVTSEGWNVVTDTVEECQKILVPCVESSSMGSVSEMFPASSSTMATLLAIVTMWAALSENATNVSDLGFDANNETATEFPYLNATELSSFWGNGTWNETLSTSSIPDEFDYQDTTAKEDVSYDDYVHNIDEEEIDPRSRRSVNFDQEETSLVHLDEFTRRIQRFKRYLEDHTYIDYSNGTWPSINETALELLRENITMYLENATLTTNESLGNFTEFLRDAIQFVNLTISTTESTFDEDLEQVDGDVEDEVEDSWQTATTTGCFIVVCPNETETTVTEEYTLSTEFTTVAGEGLDDDQTEATASTTTMMTTTTTSSATEPVDGEKFLLIESTISEGLNPDETSTTPSPMPPTTPLPPRSTTPRFDPSIFEDIPELQRRTLLIEEKYQQKIRSLCWETMFGREILKLNVMDIILFCMSVFCMDFLRALFVRFMNKCWCWDLEKKFPRYNDFKIAENILHLINNQGMVWMGMFFSPGLAIINMVKLVIILYLRSWAVLTCNVPHSVVFRASRSNNFYLGLLLTMLFLCVLPVAYMIVWIEPSWHCGPFSDQDRISVILTETIRKHLPTQFHFALDRIASASTVIPMLVLLILIIYYLLSLTGALREANQDLRNQLRRERMEERKKMHKMNEEQKQNPQENPTISLRWRKVLDSASSPLTPTTAGGPVDPEEALKIQEKKERLQRIMKKALRKGSATSDEESVVHHHHQQQQQNHHHHNNQEDENTDSEQHESLPHDQEDEDNKINTQKQGGEPKKRDLFPELIKKLRESAKKQTNGKGEAPGIDVVQPQKKTPPQESTDDDERVVRERRKSLLRKGMKGGVAGTSSNAVEPEGEAKFDVIDETSGSGGGGGGKVEKQQQPKKSKVKAASVFTFDVPPQSASGAAKEGGNISSSDNDGGKGQVSPKSPIYATVNKQAKKSPTDQPSDDSLKGKFNSFFTIVREAVRRQSIAEQLDSAEGFTSLSSSAIRSPRTTHPPIDSDCSIWSDNVIPVITISRGSDECILEEDKKAKSSAPSSDGDDKKEGEEVSTEEEAKREKQQE